MLTRSFRSSHFHTSTRQESAPPLSYDSSGARFGAPSAFDGGADEHPAASNTNATATLINGS